MSDDNAQDERRSHDRIPIDMMVDFGEYSAYQLNRCAQLANISGGGVFIQTNDLHPVGTKLQLEFGLPGKSKKIQAVAIVRWVYNQPSSVHQNSSGMGVEFESISERDHKAVLKYLSSAQ